jgi:hypothetical protein
VNKRRGVGGEEQSVEKTKVIPLKEDEANCNQELDGFRRAKCQFSSRMNALNILTVFGEERPITNRL